MFKLAISGSFEYQCYGSTVIIFVNSSSARIDIRRQILTSVEGPRAERVKAASRTVIYVFLLPADILSESKRKAIQFQKMVVITTII